MNRYKFHSNRFGVSVHFGSNTVLIPCQQIRLDSDVVYESSAGVTVQDRVTGTKIFIPQRLVRTYNSAKDEAMKDLEYGGDSPNNMPWGKKSVRGP